MGVEPTQVGTKYRFSHSEYKSGVLTQDKNPVCLHAIGFRLLASSIPRTMVHCLLPAIHHNDVFLTAAYFVALFVNACNLKGRLLLEFY